MNPCAAELRGRQYDHALSLSGIVAIHNYRAADGTLLYQLVRLRPRGRRWRRPDPASPGGWTWSRQGVPRVLYRLPELLKADAAAWTFIVNTERAADAIAALGLTGTCCPGGIRRWCKVSDWSALAGRRLCIIVPSESLTAWIYAEDVARRLADKVAVVKIVALPGRDKSVYDWIKSYGAAQHKAKGRSTHV